MATTTTTFAIFQSLLRESVTKDTALSSATRAAMLARIDDLARDVELLFNFDNVDSSAGSVSIDHANKSIELAVGVLGTNRVEWSLMTFSVPVTISGVKTAIGAFFGNAGTSVNALVADADISLQYRFSSTDNWKNLDKATVLETVTAIQIAADIADQASIAALPGVVIVAKQE